jgi:hypothetical protein
MESISDRIEENDTRNGFASRLRRARLASPRPVSGEANQARAVLGDGFLLASI